MMRPIRRSGETMLLALLGPGSSGSGLAYASAASESESASPRTIPRGGILEAAPAPDAEEPGMLDEPAATRSANRAAAMAITSGAMRRGALIGLVAGAILGLVFGAVLGSLLAAITLGDRI